MAIQCFFPKKHEGWKSVVLQPPGDRNEAQQHKTQFQAVFGYRDHMDRFRNTSGLNSTGRFQNETSAPTKEVLSGNQEIVNSQCVRCEKLECLPTTPCHYVITQIPFTKAMKIGKHRSNSGLGEHRPELP